METSKRFNSRQPTIMKLTQFSPFDDSSDASIAEAIARNVAALPDPDGDLSSIALPGNVTDDVVALTSPAIISFQGARSLLLSSLNAAIGSASGPLVTAALEAQRARLA